MNLTKRTRTIGLSLFILCLVCISFEIYFKNQRRSDMIPLEGISRWKHLKVIPIATQICNDRFGELVTMIKSMLLHTRAHLTFYIFVDEDNWNKMYDTLLSLRKMYPENLSATLLPVSYPRVKGRNYFAEKTKPCSTIRVFFPSLLPDIDSVIYLDTDMIFFRPIEELWSRLSEFNKVQVLAIAPDSPRIDNWYTHKAKHPYYGNYGLNTGVMLMNLTRLRELHYTDIILDLFEKWQTKIMWGEQDLHNIWFHYHPEKLYDLPCEWNYRDSHCEIGNHCEGAEKEGPYVLHGNGQQLVQIDVEPGFYAVNKAFLEYSSGQNAKENVYRAMKQNLMGVTKDNTKCTAELLRLFNHKFQGL